MKSLNQIPGIGIAFLLSLPGALSAEEPPASPGHTLVVEAPESQTRIPVQIEWRPVPGVTRYRVEIRDHEQKLIQQNETEDTRLKMELPEGEYEKRVGLINKFNKLYLWTDWNPLHIIRILQPKIETPPDLKPIQRGSGKKSVSVHTKGAMPQTEYHLLDRNGKSVDVPISEKGGEVVLDIDPDRLPPGSYDLVMKNPEGKQDIERRIITIQPSTKEQATIRREKLSTLMLVPGLPQIERGQRLKGSSLLVAFATSAAMTAYSYQQAAKLYRGLNSDAMYAIIKDPTTATTFAPTIASSPILYYSTLGSYNRWQSDTASYNRYRAYYYLGIGLTAGLYAFHLTDVYRFEIGMTRTAAGEPGMSAALSFDF